MAVNMKETTDLMNYFSKSVESKTGKKPQFNRAIEKWSARDLIESYGLANCHRAVDWYCKVYRFYDWKEFVRVAGDCITEYDMVIADSEARKQHRAIADKWRKS